MSDLSSSTYKRAPDPARSNHGQRTRSGRQIRNSPTNSRVSSRGNVEVFVERPQRLQSGAGRAHRDLQAPLETREAFYRGRTNAIRLYAQVEKEDGEEIRYDDYTSLYPWVNKRIPRRTCYLPLRTRHHRSLALFRVRSCCLTVVMAS